MDNYDKCYLEFMQKTFELNEVYQNEIDRLNELILKKEHVINELENKINLLKTFIKNIRIELQDQLKK